MKVKIKRVDKTLPLPQYQTEGSVAFDLYSRIDATIEPNSFDLLPANFIVETPPGYMLLITARSSSAKNKGLNMRNGAGIIDQDYCGEEDELRLLLQNLTDKKIEIKKGERLAQAAFVRVDRFELEEVEQMDGASRGGFGSTG